MRISLPADATAQGPVLGLLGPQGQRLQAFFQGRPLKYRDGGVVRQCAKGGANKIRAPAPTVPGPRPAHRPEHTNAGVSVSRELDFEPALPFTMGTVGSDSGFQDCVSPTASASGHMGACFD
ncbi:TPA: hypothetical protein ACH3X1_011453 [Trebouxia sp. C0004]